MLSVPLCISETLLDATHSTLSIFVLLKVMSSYNSNDFAFDCDLLPQFSDSGMSDSIPDEDRALLESSDESTGGSLSSTSITSVPDSLDSAPSGGSLSSTLSITSVPDSLDASDDEIMEEDHPGQRQTTLRLALPRISVVRASTDDTVIIPVEIRAPRLSAAGSTSARVSTSASGSSSAAVSVADVELKHPTGRLVCPS